MAKIFIDPGHGGNDPGASGQGLVEKQRNLSVALRVQYHLERNGQTVFMGRTTDKTMSLTERSNIANANSVDASISIHCNAAVEEAKGLETFTYGRGTNEIKLAECVHNSILNAGLYSLNRGIKQADFHMVREPNMAAILVEMAFITNPSDAALLKKTEDFAIAIAKGLIKYVNGSWKDEATTPTTPQPSGEMYRVRKTWADAISQIGAYSVLDNAIQKAKENSGYCVFDSKGTQVYPTVSKPEPAQMYRIRLSWADSSSQKGAYTVLDNAIIECRKYPGYSVYNEAGQSVYLQPPLVATDKEVRRYTEYGNATITVNEIYFRNKPTTDSGSTIQGSYYKNETVNYDLVVVSEKYVWISWVSASAGVRRYMPVRVVSTGERWANCV